ncbi:MAG: hypothetical protein WAT67_07545 [Candidatus Contendobacter sp.]
MAALPQPPIGRAWGTRRGALVLGGEVYGLKNLSALQALALRHHYPQFMLRPTSPQRPALEISLCAWLHPPTNPIAVTARGQYAPILTHSPSRITITGVNFQAQIDRNKAARATLSLRQGTPAAHLNAIDNVLRVVAAYRALSVQGLLLHSAGLVLKDRRAYLFIGHSGVGKTTLSRKARTVGVSILSDDINIVSPSGTESFQAYPVPFTGALGQTATRQAPSGYPLAGLFFLEQGSATHVHALSKAAAVARLVAASPFVNADPYLSFALLQTAAAVARQVPTQTLVSRREDDFTPIHALLRELTDV